MRETLFRGKRIDNEEWCYGYYVRIYNKRNNTYLHYIYTGYAEIDCDEVFPDYVEIIPKTLGQFVKMEDTSSTKIFEGDIVTAEEYPFKDDGVFNYNGEIYFDNENYLYAVKLYCVNPNKRGISHGESRSLYERYRLVVIGNVHDNPELLEV